MTGGDLLVSALAAGGVDTVFGLPGVQLDGFFDALSRRSDLRVIHTRHEQATSYMADGYARVSKTGVGCCAVVPGPGVLNALAGLSTAYACNSRVFCVAGQVRSDLIDSGLGLLHEIPNQLGVLRSVAKWVERADQADRIPELVATAFRELRSGRPRPVALEVPLDVLEATVVSGFPGNDESSAAKGPGFPGNVEETAALDRMAERLLAAERPLITAGGGVVQARAGALLQDLAERLQAPVLVSQNGRGALPTDHELAFDTLSAGALVAAADVVLAVGTRFAGPGGRRRRLQPGQSLLRIDADPEELARDVEPELAVAADAGAGLSALLARLDGRPPAAGWDGLEAVRAEAEERRSSLQPQAALGAAIRAALPADSVVVNGMTQVGYWGRIGFQVLQPGTFLTAGYQGTLGFELPLALGAQAALPDRRVLAIVGDGGFLFNAQELATAVQHRLNVIAVVFNDGAYGNVRRIQAQRYGGRLIASDLHNPDFVRLADAFGALGLRAEGPEALGAAIRQALQVDRPAVIEVPVGEMDDPWPLLLSN
ncbi:MAG TPA: thiamine pyrophosphate-dependent enzyme [Candidatus Dormibacteraeota bacterium]